MTIVLQNDERHRKCGDIDTRIRQKWRFYVEPILKKWYLFQPVNHFVIYCSFMRLSWEEGFSP